MKGLRQTLCLEAQGRVRTAGRKDPVLLGVAGMRQGETVAMRADWSSMAEDSECGDPSVMPAWWRMTQRTQGPLPLTSGRPEETRIYRDPQFTEIKFLPLRRMGAEKES